MPLGQNGSQKQERNNIDNIHLLLLLHSTHYFGKQLIARTTTLALAGSRLVFDFLIVLRKLIEVCTIRLRCEDEDRVRALLASEPKEFGVGEYACQSITMASTTNPCQRPVNQGSLDSTTKYSNVVTEFG
eukprot:scaffold24869_cov78-Skeletonema_dohrnii-CCMP3373.AAC.2